MAKETKDASETSADDVEADEHPEPDEIEVLDAEELEVAAAYRAQLSEDRTELSKLRTEMSIERTQFSQERVAYAEHRTHLANQRTYLAWVRTGLSLVGFGFGVTKFVFQHEEKTPKFGSLASVISGLAMVIVGMAIVILAYIRYRSSESALNEKYNTYEMLAASIAVVMALVGAVITFDLIYSALR